MKKVLKRINLKNVSEIFSDSQLKQFVGKGYYGDDSDKCLKCQGAGGCYIYIMPSGTDCWSYGDVGCMYGFACGPCSQLSQC